MTDPAIAVLEARLAEAEHRLGPMHPALAELFDELTAVATQLNDLPRAADAARRAVEIRQATLPSGHPIIGMSLVTLAMALMRPGRYAEARVPAEAAVDLLRRALEPGHDAMVAALDTLALVLEGAGDLPAARAAALELVGLVDRPSGPVHPRLPAALELLAGLAIKLGEFEPAEAMLQRALGLRRSGAAGTPGGVAMPLSALGSLAQQRGHDEKAEAYHREALAIRHRDYGPDHPLTVMSLVNLAQSKYHQGALIEARSLAEAALERQGRTQGAESLAVATTLHSLAAIHRDLGDYDRAQAALDGAFEIRHGLLGAHHALVAETRRARAALLATLGDPAAEFEFRAVLEIIDAQEEPDDGTRAATLDGLGVVLERRGQPGEARQCLDRAIELRRAALGPDHPYVAHSLRNLGRLHLGQNDAAALACFEDALAIRRAALGPEHPDVGTSLADIGLALLALGRPRAARDAGAAALAIALRHNSPSLRWEALWTLSLALAAEGETSAAIHLGKMAVDAIQTQRQRTASFSPAQQQSFVRGREPAYRSLAELLIRAGRLAEAQQILLLLKDEEFRDFLRQAAGPPRLSFAALTLLEVRWRLDPTQAMAGAVTPWLDQLIQAFRAGDTAMAEPLLDLPQLDPDTALIQYLTTEHSVSIILTATATRTSVTVKLNETVLNRLVHEFRVAIRHRTDDVEALAISLYRHLMAPIEAQIGSTGRLIIMLDGVLRYVPIAALHDGKHYLVERFEIAVLTPAGHTASSDRRARDSWQVAGLGLGRAVPGHAPLAAVAEELGAIVRTDPSQEGLYPGIVRLDDAFTEASLMEALGSYPVTHVASHFVLNPADGLSSYLLLGTGARLTLEALRRQDFRAASDLVALSACETAIGAGREVEGMAALMQSRGARAVLATLWPVNDRATARLMRDFYAECRDSSATKSAALRTAQRRLLATPDRVHPFYWAPFILMGDWR